MPSPAPPDASELVHELNAAEERIAVRFTAILDEKDSSIQSLRAESARLLCDKQELLNERDQLRAESARLRKERDQLQETCSSVVNELHVKLDALRLEGDQLRAELDACAAGRWSEPGTTLTVVGTYILHYAEHPTAPWAYYVARVPCEIPEDIIAAGPIRLPGEKP